MTSNKISIVILNWNGSSFLKRFLPSIVANSASNSEIVVADNGSTDDSRNVIETLFPSVVYLQLERNFGFAEGYNRALAQLQADYFLLINSDVEVTHDWLEPMLLLMQSDPSIGICQPKILSFDRRDEFEYAGAAGGFIDRFGFPYCRGRILQKFEKDMGQYNQSVSVSWASGACMMVKSSLWHECGGFDADFWAHMEEIDLCWRAQHLGYSVYVCPDSVVYHVGGGTLNYNHPLKIYLNFRNNLYLLLKNLRGMQLVTLLLPRLILDVIAALVFLISGKFRAFASVFRAHLSFYGNLSALVRKRRKILNQARNRSLRVTSQRSILWNYFVLGRRKYSEL